MAAHRREVRNERIFRFVCLETACDAYVGALECTDRNEIGVHILKKYQRDGYGTEAMKLFFRTHKPLPSVKAVRNGRWLVNVAPDNEEAKAFFRRLGFTKVQETFCL